MARVAGIQLEKNYKGEILNVSFNWKKFKDTIEPILQQQGIVIESPKEKKERLEIEKMRMEGTPYDEVFDKIRANLANRYDVNGVKINNL